MNKKERLKKLPPIFLEISKRFASDYLISEQLHLRTICEIGASKFPLNLLPKTPFDKQSPMIFNKIFSKVIDNDKKLSILLKKAEIESLYINKE